MPKHETLPADYHMAIIELEGRYYPVITERDKESGQLRLDGSPHLHWEGEYAYGIPYALGPQPTRGAISFATYQRAIDFCHRYREEFHVLWHWQQQAAQTELYPERGAWYREAFKQLCGTTPNFDVVADKAYASIFLRSGTYCRVLATTMDEAREKLYTQVEEMLYEQWAATLNA